MSKSNKYGYSGVDIPTQAFKSNVGKFDPAEINELVANDQWTQYGQLELIETQTVSSDVATVSFDSIQENTYNVHFITVNNFQPTNDNRHLAFRLKVNGTTTTGFDYKYAMSQNNITNGGREHKSGNDSKIWLAYNSSFNSGEGSSGYLYVYNAGDSSKYTFLTSQFTTFRDTAEIQTNFNSGIRDETGACNGFEFATSGGNITEGVFSLYGIKEYS